MRHLTKIISIIFLAFSLSKTCAQNKELSLIIHVKDSINKLPAEKDDWFVVNFVCYIKNNSSDTIYFVDPKSYKIFPHPWTISINGKDAEFWPGSITCAPSFDQTNIIKIAPKATIVTSFDWHTFVTNFTKNVGTYSAKVKYNYVGDKTWTMGADKTNLSDTETKYSNIVTFKIIK
jgi:hypothetical protein